MPARAQSFPSKPIRWVIPFPPAGNYDVTSRIVGEAMGRRLGQTIVADNRPGAGGIVGTEAAANAPADGYTVVMGSFSVQWVAPYLAGKPPMVPLFAPISLLTTVPMVIVAKSDGRFADMKAVLAEARSKPGTVSIGHAGNGTTNHIAILRLQVNDKVQFNIIPYKGSGPGLADLMAGQTDLYTDQLTTSLPHIKAGKLKALAVTSAQRSAALPDLPTIAEAAPHGSKLKDYEASSWFGLLAPAGTAPEIVNRIAQESARALNAPALKERLLAQGAIPSGMPPAEFAAFIGAETKKWGVVVKASGAKVD